MNPEKKSPRKDEVTNVTIQDFECKRLGGTARLTVIRRYCVHEDPKETHIMLTDMKECQNKFDCGLYVWDIKPYSFHATEPPSEGCEALRALSEGGNL